MAVDIGITTKEYIIYKLYARLSEGNPITRRIRTWMINNYFDPKLKRNPAIEANWLQEYFRLLVGFNGVCQRIDLLHRCICCVDVLLFPLCPSRGWIGTEA